MITPWQERIRRRGELRIAELGGAGVEPWQGVVARAVDAFNRLAADRSLGVTWRLVDAPGDAEVTVDTRPGSSLIGSARLHRFVPDGRPIEDGRVIQVDIHVPADPRINTPSAYRRVGPGVLLAMMVHEMVHACGLSNEEHARAGDLFQASPTVIAGDTAAGDRMGAGVRDRGGDEIGMPPLRLTDATAGKIRQAWQDPASTPAPAPTTGGPATGARRPTTAARGPLGFAPDADPATGARAPGPLGTPVVAGTRDAGTWDAGHGFDEGRA